ncbi:neuroglian-like [Contarinia nasturtii]|uniref:neuroglian-like n=1 Tax=Contarinia nasturtii TaxID=265458 RepID=UPI0012D46DFB|nr:neuroglian-like [Contarinia nasturtii]
MERRKEWKILLFYTLVFARMVHSLNALHVSPPKIVLQPPNTEIIHPIGDNSNGNDKPLELKCKAESEIEIAVERATVNEGDEISFSWIHSNDSTNHLKFSNNVFNIKYRWTKDGKPFDWTANSRVELRLGEGTLIINNPHEEDNGQYQCFCQNDYGVATSNSVFVRVFKLNPSTEVKPETVNVTEGHPARLECIAPAKWPKPFVFWVKLNATEENFMTFEKINTMEKLGTDIWSETFTLDRHGNLYFFNVSTDDASEDGFHYVCVATIEPVKAFQILKRVHLNVMSESSQMIESTFNKNALVYKSNEHEDVMVGEFVSMFCIFDGKPHPIVIWRKDGDVNYIVRRFLFGYALLNDKMSLTDRRAHRNDTGSYDCDSSSLEKQTLSFHLTVNVPPLFLVKPKEQHLNDGDTAKFECKADGVPNVSIKWTYNGKPIEANSHITIEPNAIIIENVTWSDIGNYGCNASNSVGYIYEDVYLNIAKPSPALLTPENTTSFFA